MLNDDTAALKAHLKTLHTSLAETGTVDEELRTLLRQLDGDIHQLLQQRSGSDAAGSGPALGPASGPASEPAPGPASGAVSGTVPGAVGGAFTDTSPSSSADDGLSTRAQELAARFAAQHPRMEPALRQLGNILANMGI